jgi:large subunit ribosomal protein L14
MVSVLTWLKVVDNSGAFTAKCIKVLKVRRRQGRIGDLIVVSIRSVNPRKEKFKIGNVRYGIVVNTKNIFKRAPGITYRFGQNSVILVNKRLAPYSKRLKAPIPFEVCLNYKFIATIAKKII